eukprot:GILK01008633.1.p1 GENE.GILK01008633.1~~GILK01008633.1.p1  ORF type:complete len:1204 (+),score=208.81 GILK01008633.1:39-3650(+)
MSCVLRWTTRKLFLLCFLFVLSVYSSNGDTSTCLAATGDKSAALRTLLQDRLQRFEVSSSKVREQLSALKKFRVDEFFRHISKGKLDAKRTDMVSKLCGHITGISEALAPFSRTIQDDGVYFDPKLRKYEVVVGPWFFNIIKPFGAISFGSEKRIKSVVATQTLFEIWGCVEKSSFVVHNAVLTWLQTLEEGADSEEEQAEAVHTHISSSSSSKDREKGKGKSKVIDEPSLDSEAGPSSVHVKVYQSDTDIYTRILQNMLLWRLKIDLKISRRSSLATYIQEHTILGRVVRHQRIHNLHLYTQPVNPLSLVPAFYGLMFFSPYVEDDLLQCKYNYDDYIFKQRPDRRPDIQADPYEMFRGDGNNRVSYIRFRYQLSPLSKHADPLRVPFHRYTFSVKGSGQDYCSASDFNINMGVEKNINSIKANYPWIMIRKPPNKQSVIYGAEAWTSTVLDFNTYIEKYTAVQELARLNDVYRIAVDTFLLPYAILALPKLNEYLSRLDESFLTQGHDLPVQMVSYSPGETSLRYSHFKDKISNLNSYTWREVRSAVDMEKEGELVVKKGTLPTSSSSLAEVVAQSVPIKAKDLNAASSQQSGVLITKDETVIGREPEPLAELMYCEDKRYESEELDAAAETEEDENVKEDLDEEEIQEVPSIPPVGASAHPVFTPPSPEHSPRSSLASSVQSSTDKAPSFGKRFRRAVRKLLGIQKKPKATTSGSLTTSSGELSERTSVASMESLPMRLERQPSLAQIRHDSGSSSIESNAPSGSSGSVESDMNRLVSESCVTIQVFGSRTKRTMARSYALTHRYKLYKECMDRAAELELAREEVGFEAENIESRQIQCVSKISSEEGAIDRGLNGLAVIEAPLAAYKEWYNLYSYLLKDMLAITVYGQLYSLLSNYGVFLYKHDSTGESSAPSFADRNFGAGARDSDGWGLGHFGGIDNAGYPNLCTYAFRDMVDVWASLQSIFVNSLIPYEKKDLKKWLTDFNASRGLKNLINDMLLIRQLISVVLRRLGGRKPEELEAQADYLGSLESLKCDYIQPLAIGEEKLILGMSTGQKALRHLSKTMDTAVVTELEDNTGMDTLKVRKAGLLEKLKTLHSDFWVSIKRCGIAARHVRHLANFERSSIIYPPTNDESESRKAARQASRLLAEKQFGILLQSAFQCFVRTSMIRAGMPRQLTKLFLFPSSSSDALSPVIDEYDQ